MRHYNLIAKIILPTCGRSQEEWKRERQNALAWYQNSCFYAENPHPEIVIHPLRLRNMRVKDRNTEDLMLYFAKGWEDSLSARLLHWLCEWNILDGMYAEYPRIS